MQTRIQLNDLRTVIELLGQFDFNARAAFGDALDKVLAARGPDIMIDLSAVNYIDSSALGLLLIAQDKAKESQKTVSLTGAQGTVKEILEIANFHKRFAMS